mmetsp:Transcript_52779/g.58994  ORF Transcript_52779/g.58994 Transcript_52779/m.58994 type:complete len:151 (+) Transcript_52779:313-765(+)
MCGMHFGIALTIRNSYLLKSVAACVWLLFLPPSSDNNNNNHYFQHQKKIKTTMNDNDTSNDSSGSSFSSSSTTTATTSSSMYDKVGSSITWYIWFETIGAGCDSVTESSRLIWSTLLQNRWNVFIGAEEVSFFGSNPDFRFCYFLVDILY